jgi:hypothetical protein
MIYRLALSFPAKSTNEVISFISEVGTSKDFQTIYDVVSWLEKNIFAELNKGIKPTKTKKKTELKSVLNIHNDNGIKDLSQIKRMAEAIKSGKHILSRGIPNVKLVKTRDGELLLFDGSHSMLAYMTVGKTYLEEIPHMIITGKEKGYVEDKDIVVFYGEHASNIEGCNWKEKVINWQAPKEKQVCKRIQKNMEELYLAIEKRIKVDR